MSKHSSSLRQQIATDQELQRLKGLAGFREFERQLDVDLKKLTQRWSAWRIPNAGCEYGRRACWKAS